MFCLNSNNSIPEIHPGPDICAWVHRRSCTGDVEKPGLFHKMLWADLIKPIFESCAWPHWIPVQREVRSRWLPRSKERGEIYFSAPGKFCPSCGHQVTYNQILKMKKCQYKTTYRLRSEICGFIVLYLWIYCLYLHIYRRCLIYYICWQQILLLYFLEKILLYYQHILLKYSYISNQSCCSWKTTRSVDYIDYISTYHVIAIT